MNKSNARLLVLACSRRKRPDAKLLPAIDRYDGPAFRVLRRFLISHDSQPVQAYVLSAEFGLIPTTRLIPNYDRRMTTERAQELRPFIIRDLCQVLQQTGTDELFIVAGSVYRRLIAEFAAEIAGAVRIETTSGPIGKQLAALHDWLWGMPATPYKPKRADHRELARLRGVRVSMTTDRARDLARKALSDTEGEISRFHAWYVPIDGKRVAPKWMASQITGLNPAGFGTTEALRFLGQLGITVQRT